MNRLFNNITLRTTDGLTSDFVPAAEMSETPEEIHLKLEVTGMDAKDIDIEVSAEAVSIAGERRSETKTEAKGMTRSEFSYGSFRRVIPLPTRVENNNVKAEYKDGILNLTIPKAESEKDKVVKVNIG
ncbi:MAG TPA: Hsp20/alpha crystallin family protein [Coleofasciculaceae cyanobacterium]|jgi:HSP20 family protein